MGKKRQPSLGLFSIVLLGVNSMIGTGIYLLPSKPMALVGPSSILIYGLVTFIVLTIALCFAECATFFSKNGAAYLYAKEAFGGFVGYQVGVMKWIVSILAWAAVAVGFVMILGQAFPIASTEPYRSLIIIALLSLLGLLNILGVQHVKIVNNIIALTKLTPLLFFIALGLFNINIENFEPFVPPDIELGSIGEAALIVFFAFSGFETLGVAAEDMRNPQRNIPLAIIIVLGIAAATYFLIQFVVIGVLGPDLAASVTPIADAAASFFGPHGRLLILASTLISSIGINIMASFTTPKIVAVLAEDGLLPSFLKNSRKDATPYAAILASVVLTLGAALSGSFIKLATISVIARLCQYIPTCLAVFALRKKYGQQSRFFPKFLELIIPLFGVLFSLWLLSNASLDELVWGAGAMVIATPIYFAMKNRTGTHLCENASKI